MLPSIWHYITTELHHFAIALPEPDKPLGEHKTIYTLDYLLTGNFVDLLARHCAKVKESEKLLICGLNRASILAKIEDHQSRKDYDLRKSDGMSGGTSPSVDSSSPSPSCHGDQRNAANEGQRLKHTRRPRASREEVERPGSLTSPSTFQSSQGSPQMSETMSDVISDAKLVSLNEGRTPRSSVDYDQLLSKAAALLKEKNEREEEVATLRARNDSLLELNRTIREKSVRLHAKAEQEEEFISNMLLKRIQKLKNDKEAIALKYEQEEEFLTNDLTRKLSQVASKAAEASAGVTLQNERDELAGRAKAEQSCVVDTLLVKIRKLEAEINANHVALEQLRREKVDLENALEHEQEQLFNTLGKRMDQLEAEKRRMQARLDQASVSEDQSPASSNSEVFGCSHEDNGERRSSRAEIEARKLREECSRLRAVIATQKSTITNLQQQMNAQESKYVAGLLAVREKSAETRADIRRARISLEGNLTRCLDACRALANSQTARESDEDKRIDVLLSRISVPKSGAPTLIPTANNPVVTALSSAETDASWHDERPLSARSESQGDRMEEGSEAADTDGDTQMDSNFFSCEHLPPQSDELSRFSDEPTKLLTSYPSSISAASNEDSNESTESVNAAMGQFARPALPPNRSPVAKKDY